MKEKDLSEIWKEAEWDSTFFGFKIVQLFQPFNKEEFAEYESIWKKTNVKLVYSFCAPGSPEFSILQEAGATCPAHRISFRMDISDKQHANINLIESFSPSDNYARLIELALQSGVYSRFRQDYLFPSILFEQLYIEWIRKSVDRTIADEVLVVYVDDDPAGMITIKKENQIAKIGLFSVSNLYRRKGIGSILVEGAIQWALKNTCTSLEVTGQLENRVACIFYEQSGMEMFELKNTMHLWLTGK